MLEFIMSIFAYVFILFGYISTTNLYPEPLSKSEEEYLLKKKLEKDLNARKKLIEHNLRLVAHIAKKYSSNMQENEEYISIGTIGLIKGIDSFSPDKGFKLSTYISKCAENEILMHLRNNKKIQNDVSINSVIGVDKDGNDMELIDTIETKELDQVEQIYNKMMKSQVIKYINEKLDKRERDIIYMRYGILGSKEMTQQEVADKLKISRSYVLSTFKNTYHEKLINKGILNSTNYKKQ